MIGARPLFRALLPRALGPAGGRVLLAAALLAGLVAALAARGQLGSSTRPGLDLLGALLRNYPVTACVAIGLVFAFRTTADASADGQRGWMQQVLAAGATRERYLLALVTANTAVAALLYLASAGTWALALVLFSEGAAGLETWLRRLPAALPWLAAVNGFAAAAIGLTTRGAAARTLMVCLAALPWIAVLSFGPAREASPPRWLTLLFRLSLPYIDPSLRGVSIILVYTGVMALTALFLAHRLLRVR